MLLSASHGDVFATESTLSASTYRALEVADFSLESYKGKVVYLDFWASWCKPCREAFPFMTS